MAKIMERLNETTTFHQETDTSVEQLEAEFGGLVFKVAMGLSLYSLALLTCVGNAMVIHAIRTEKRLKTVSNLFIMSLAVADLVVGAFVMPISAIYALTNRWYLGKWLCEAWLSIDYTASTASIFSLFVLSADRYWSIMSPLKYLRKRTKRRALALITAAWVLSSLWILPVTTWHLMLNQGLRTQPDHVCDTEFAHNVPFKVTAAVVNFYIPTLAMLYIYVRIFCTIRQRSRNCLGEVSCTNGTKEVRFAPRLPNPTEREARDPQKRIEENPTSQVVSSTNRSNPQTGIRLHGLARRLRSSTSDSCDTASVSGVDFTVQEATNVSEFQFKRTLVSWYRGKPRQSVTPLPQNSGTISSRPAESSMKVYSLYQRLTLLEIANNSIETAKEGNDGSVSHFENIRVNVEYVAEEELGNEGSRKNDSTFQVGEAALRDIKRTSSGESRNSCDKPKDQRSRSVPGVLISQKERKAARQLGVIMCAFIMCWLPYFIVFLVVAVCPNCISGTLQNVTLWLGYANSTLNPVLYPLCNANFRRAFTKMFRRSLRTSWSKNPNEFDTSCNNRY